MIRTELRLWNVCGCWGATWEAVEVPNLYEEEVEPEYVSAEPDRDLEAAAQEWLDSRLVRLEPTGPVYRSVGSIEESDLWKFTACREHMEMSEEEAWDDPLLLAHYSLEKEEDTDSEEPPLSPALIQEIEQIPAAESGIAVPIGCS